MMDFLQRMFDFLAGRSGYRQVYRSDLARFMDDYLVKHPEEIDSQKRGRAIWWDKRPEERAPVPSMRHAPKAGGNEATFQAGGYEYTFKPDDNAPLVSDKDVLKAP